MTFKVTAAQIDLSALKAKNHSFQWNLTSLHYYYKGDLKKTSEIYGLCWDNNLQSNMAIATDWKEKSF